jgi:hypothetical protein
MTWEARRVRAKRSGTYDSFRTRGELGRLGLVALFGDAPVMLVRRGDDVRGRGATEVSPMADITSIPSPGEIRVLGAQSGRAGPCVQEPSQSAIFCGQQTRLGPNLPNYKPDTMLPGQKDYVNRFTNPRATRGSGESEGHVSRPPGCLDHAGPD